MTMYECKRLLVSQACKIRLRRAHTQIQLTQVAVVAQPCGSASAWLRPGPGSASAWLRLSYAFSVFMHNEINRVLKEKVKNVLAVPGGN